MEQIKWMWQMLGKNRKLLLLAVTLSVITTVSTVINPRLIQVLVDKVVVGVTQADGTVLRDTGIVVPTLIAIVLVQFFRMLFRYCMHYSYETTSQRLMMDVRTTMYDKVQAMDMRFYDRNKIGDLMTRFTGDLDMLRHAIAWITFSTLDTVLFFLSTVVYLFTMNVLLTVILICLAPLIILVSTKLGKTMIRYHRNNRRILSDLTTVVTENIAGNRVVKAFTREDYEIDKFSEKNREFWQANRDTNSAWLRYFPIIEGISSSMTVITILVGGLLIIKGQLTPGQLIAFTSLTWAIIGPMRNLGTLINEFQRFIASCEKVMDLYYAKPMVENPKVPAEIKDRLAGKIEYKNVTFSFDHIKVLDRISFSVEPGQTIAVMGATGTGKTTLVNLLLRFYDPDSGEILVDGVNIKNYNMQQYRRNIGLTTQEVFLFSDSADSNIAYGRPDMSEEEAVRIAKAADADSFIRTMEKGYDTIIGERGVGLSGGQKQRIALARALAVRPSILVLDDTTSALDLETEQYIQGQLKQLDFSCTKFIIAQRISSVRDADKIIVLEDHKISEMGTHEELLARKGYYYQIYALQNNLE